MSLRVRACEVHELEEFEAIVCTQMLVDSPTGGTYGSGDEFEALMLCHRCTKCGQIFVEPREMEEVDI